MVSNTHNLILDLIDSNLTLGDQIHFKVVSNSMAPLIRSEDSLVANIQKPDSIKPGDIVVIRREKDFLTHRALKLIDGKWITKGDNTVQLDPPSKVQDIIGCVVGIKRETQSITFEPGRWHRINLMIAKLSMLEAQAYAIKPYLRLPFRFGIKIMQKYLMRRGY